MGLQPLLLDLPVEILWYRTRFDVSQWKDKDVILHFGAVDYKSTLYINGQEVGTHVGGNDPFSYNITPFLNGEKKLHCHFFMKDR